MDLSIDDLAITYKETFTARSSWYNLGLALKVPVATLDDIDGRSRDPKDLLCEVLKTWLRRAHKPTWQSLVDALDNPIVDEPRLARMLQEKYCVGAEGLGLRLILPSLRYYTVSEGGGGGGGI